MGSECHFSQNSMINALSLSDEEKKVALAIKNIACDGFYLYVYTTHGLCKIGTGYNGTIPRNIYAYNPTFFGLEDGWIGYVKVNISRL